MRILLYGEIWPGTVAFFYEKAFRRLGHQTSVFDFTRLLPFQWLPGRISSRVLAMVFGSTARRINEAFLREASPGFDLIIVNKGIHLRPESIRKLRSTCARIVNVNQDDFFNRNAYVWSPYLAPAFSEYDAILTPRKHRMELYRERGARHVEHLPFAFDPSMHHPVRILPPEHTRWSSDVAFVGTWSPRREAFLSAIPAHLRVSVWGASWRRSSLRFQMAQNVRIHPPLPCDGIPHAISGSRIAINLFTAENFDDYSLRTFEIPACGGFQLSEDSETARGYFRADYEASYFSTTSELVEKCEYYMSDQKQRESIAREGHRRALTGGYTYDSRAAELLAAVERAPSR